MNLADRCDLSPSFSKAYYSQEAGWEGNPGGKHSSYQSWQIPMTTTLCSSLPNIFMCSSAPEDFASFHLLGMHRETDCEVQFTLAGKENALQTFTSIYQRSCWKKPSKTLDARKCKFPSKPWRGWGGPSRDDKCCHQVSAALCFLLTFPPSSNGWGKESLKKVTCPSPPFSRCSCN